MTNFADEEARHERWQTEPDDVDLPSASDLALDASLDSGSAIDPEDAS